MVFILKSERKKIILEKVLTENFVTLETLVSLLDTSESTVRRDLDELEAERQLRRVHGGAEKLHSLQEELTNQQKAIKNVQEKRRVAQKALDYIEADEVIFIEAGTTTELLVASLNRTDVTVVTNSPHHAITLTKKGIPTILIGGNVKYSTDANIGPIAIRQIEALNFDKGFLGTNGIDERYLTTPDIFEASIKEAVIGSSKEAYVLSDSTKLGQKSFAKFASLNQVILLVNRSDKAIIHDIKEQTEVVEV